jgi:hypothetical protein
MATPTLSNLIEAELHARQLLIEKGVPSPLADEVIQLIRAESSKEEDADATQTRLQKISQDLARRTVGASADPGLIANQAKEYYDILLGVVKGLIVAGAGAAAGTVVLERKSIIEGAGGALGEAVKAVRDLFKDIGLSETPHAQKHPAHHPTGHHHPTQPAAHANPTGHPTQPGAQPRNLAPYELHSAVYGFQQRSSIPPDEIEKLMKMDDDLKKLGLSQPERIQRIKRRLPRLPRPIKR